MTIKSIQIMTPEAHAFPNGKKAVVVFSIDDFHPATQALHGYEAGGARESEALGYLKRLLLENKTSLYHQDQCF